MVVNFMTDMRISVAVFAESTDVSWRWVAGHFNSDVTWKFVRLTPPASSKVTKLKRLSSTIMGVISARRVDVIVSHGPLVAMLVEAARRFVGVQTPHLVYSFNYTELPTGRRLALARRLFSRIDRFVVSSATEIEMYSRHFGIAPGRFDLVLWGVNSPQAAEAEPPEYPYVCAIGGNARDYAVLMAAAKELPDIRFKCVVRPLNLSGITIPDNVSVQTNLPLSSTMAILRDARLMVLPLLNGAVPCGHVTLVSAYYLQTPVIVTDSAGVSDYVRHRETGLLVSPGSADELSASIKELWESPLLRKNISDSANKFVLISCSEQNYVNHFSQCIDRLKKSTM
jgi:glycosyltransferase involved in cell wall biosynthesis